MEQVQKKKASPSKKEEAVVEVKASEKASKEKAERDAMLDDFLDEIDAVLVENAEEFVTSYVQRGGE